MRRRDAIADAGGWLAVLQVRVMPGFMQRIWRPAYVAAAIGVLAVVHQACAQESPVRIAVYGGTCSVLLIAGASSTKPCIGTLMVNGFADGSKSVIFHNADDEAIAFQAVPLQGEHFGVKAVEVNGQTTQARGTCTIQLDAHDTGEIRCEAQMGGHVTSGTFQVTGLNHVIGAP